MGQSIITLTGSKGLNTKYDPVRLTPGKDRVAWLAEAVNVVVDASGRPTLAPGYDRIATGSWHSLWSDGPYTLGVQDGYLVKIHQQTLAVTQLQALTDVAARMRYVLFFDRVYFSNGTDSGVLVDETISSWGAGTPDDPGSNLRQYGGPPQTINLMEVYAGRLFIASGRVVHVSERRQPDVFRRMFELPFPTEVTLLQAVADGLWIGDREGLYHCTIAGPMDEWALVRRYDAAGIPNMAVKVDPTSMPYEPLIGSGRVIKACTPMGLVVLGAQGFVVNETFSIIEPDKPPFPFNSATGVVGSYEDYTVMSFGE